MPSWKEIRDFQYTRSVAEAAQEFQDSQQAERIKPPADVFVSYSSQDRALARSLCSELDKEHVAYFLDEKSIQPGDDLSRVLEREIRARSHYLLVLSEHSASSDWVVYEAALAKGAGLQVRMLRTRKDIIPPPPLSAIVAGDDLVTEAKYYASLRYDPLAIQVLLRDILRPLRMAEALAFRAVAGSQWTWRHPDADGWPAQDQKAAFKRQFDLAGDPPPRVETIHVDLTATPPRLVLKCSLERAFETVIRPSGNTLTLDCWWRALEDGTTIRVHPAFWNSAVKELVSLLNRQSKVLTRLGVGIDNLFPVAWAR